MSSAAHVMVVGLRLAWVGNAGRRTNSRSMYSRNALDPGTVDAREELCNHLLWQFKLNFHLPLADGEGHSTMRRFIFHWDYVVPIARFIHAVAKNWHHFGNVLCTRTCEDDPGFEEDRWQ